MQRWLSLVLRCVCARPLRKPSRAAVLLGTLLTLQVLLVLRLPNEGELRPSAGMPPNLTFMRLASLDDAWLSGYATALYLQSFDAQAGAQLPLRLADFQSIRAWLELAFALNPKSGYPLMLGAFEYAETAHLQDELLHPENPEAAAILDFVERGFRTNPAAHWRWLVHACWVARYRLHDDQRAAAEAQLLRNTPIGTDIPQWARELDLFLAPQKDEIRTQFASPTTSRGDAAIFDARSVRRSPQSGQSVLPTDARSQNAIAPLLSTSLTSSSVQTFR